MAGQILAETGPEAEAVAGKVEADASTETADAGDATAPTEECRDEAPKPELDLRPVSYAWDQTEDFIKVYVAFDQEEELQRGVSEDQVSVEFGEWSVLIQIRSAEAGGSTSPFGVRIGDFQRRVDPDRCSYKVTSSRITVRLRKQERDHWFGIVQRKRPDRR
mmetsp:Transcript_35602/g.83233  ORF Transcript_35602/g.83233 Transcript_35602/m.83233 type:complete len:162 (+) Transcript_35602:87-572(+)